MATPIDLRIFSEMKSHPGKICISSDGHQAYLPVDCLHSAVHREISLVDGGMQAVYSGGRDLNKLDKADFRRFVYDVSYPED